MDTTTAINLANMTTQEAFDILKTHFYEDKRNPGASGPDQGIQCYYTEEDGSPSCIIANFMEFVGIPRPVYGSDENTNATARVVLDPVLPYRVVDFLYKVQQDADGGKTWKEAIDNNYRYVI